jgi:Raf kinase inhibitor-like YbhB/YbcL family protein
MQCRMVASAALGLGAIVMLSSTGRANLPLQLTSAKFTGGAEIPSVYTCEGQSISPPLSWSDVPIAATSFAIVVDDPDAPDPKAPTRDFIHWVVYNLPGAARGLSEGVQADELPAGAVQGKNDMGKLGYAGPCPTTGRHRYFFRLYALDIALAGLHDPSKADLDDAMNGHVLAKAELVGTYQKRHK